MAAMSDKKVEVLITTVNCKNPEALLQQMHIQSAACIGNQCEVNRIDTIQASGGSYIVYNFNERGVGLNRNNLLMRTKAEYCLFGDDDLVYVDEYENIVKDAFQTYPDADVILFNLEEETPSRYRIQKPFKVNYFNFMRFGAARMAVKRTSIQTRGILFNLCFGGGCAHAHGEDTLFLNSCLKAGLHIYALPITIATLTEVRVSSWFHGYDEKYFLDKGLLYYVMSRRFYPFLILQDALRHHKTYDKTIGYLVKTMKRGVADERKRRMQ